MFGIDVGGTYIKYGTPPADFHIVPLPYSADWMSRTLERATAPILVTGAGAERIARSYPQYDITLVPELEATGLGGAYLAEVDECIVINIGSGTPILYTRLSSKEVVHITGTGLGSASLVGLSFYMTGIEDLDLIDKNALKGNPDKVNLLVRDIYDNLDLIDLPGEATASNFGKYQDWRHLSKQEKPQRADLLAALHRMVAESIAIIATSAVQQYRKGDDFSVVITGGGTLNQALLKYLTYTFEFFKQPYRIPDLAVYSTLCGLFVSKGLI